MPSACTTTVPCEAAVFDVTLSPVPASLARTDEPTSTVLAVVVPVSFMATEPTAMATVAVEVRPLASVAV